MEPYEALKQLRVLCHVKQEVVAAQFGIDQSLLSRYESGDRTLPPELVAKIKIFYLQSYAANLRELAAHLDGLVKGV